MSPMELAIEKVRELGPFTEKNFDLFVDWFNAQLELEGKPHLPYGDTGLCVLYHVCIDQIKTASQETKH